mgnify:CR=1 FL=1
MEDLEEKKKREEEIKIEREKKNDRMDALKEAKTPWFCPECKKVMKKIPGLGTHGVQMNGVVLDLLVNAGQNTGASNFHFTQIAQTLFKGTQLTIVQPAGYFFAIARDKRHCGTFVQ